jgi:hypothetical protein
MQFPGDENMRTSGLAGDIKGTLHGALESRENGIENAN